MTQTSLVQVICPDCRRQFDVPDGAAEATCPQCSEKLVWRSCLDTNEVFTVLAKWETWVHPGCETKHPVDLTHVLSAPRPQGHDPALEPVSAPQGEQTVYSPVELAEDVDWADQAITGRLIVDSDRLAILPGASSTRPPLSVAWVRDVQDYSVQRAAGDDGQKKKRFGRRKEGDAVSRPTLLMLAVPGGQISITATSQPDVLLAQLDQYLRPRITGGAPAGADAPPVPDAPAPTPSPAPSPSEQGPAIATVDAPTLDTPTGVASSPEAPAEPDVAAQATPKAAPEAAKPKGTAGKAGPQAPAVAAPPPTAPPTMPDLEPDTPEAVYESIRKLAELAVLGTISSEDFATKKAQLLARL